MKESQFQSRLLHALRHAMPQAIVVKFNDRFTSGIPDVMVSLKGMVTWFELKTDHNPATLLQRETMKRLVRAYEVRAISGRFLVLQPSWNENYEEWFDTFNDLVAEMVRICRND